MKDADALLKAYKPLILSTYKKYHPTFRRKAEKEELMQEIRSTFIRLVYEYDPRRGVDFPYYIKRMLNFRTYHYVTKTAKQKSIELLHKTDSSGQSYNAYSEGEDLETEELIDQFVELESWDDEFPIGKKQKQLFVGLIVEGKSLKQLAEEEGVEISILHTRVHFLLKKLRQHKEKQDELNEK